MSTEKAVTAATRRLSGISRPGTPIVDSMRRRIIRRGAKIASSSLKAISKPQVMSRLTAAAMSKVGLGMARATMAVSQSDMGVSKARAAIDTVKVTLSKAMMAISKATATLSKATANTKS